MEISSKNLQKKTRIITLEQGARLEKKT